MKSILDIKSFYFIAVAVSLALTAIAIGAFTFVYGKGYSYLSNNPASCGNCHVMRDHLNAWQGSSHHAVATCNDCHTPDNIVGKLAVKAIDGVAHSYAFTTGRYHDPIFIKGFNKKIAQNSCVRCHSSNWEGTQQTTHNLNETDCVRCHGSVGHRVIAR